MHDKIRSILALFISLLFILTSLIVYSDVALLDSSFCDYTGDEPSEWNVSELVDGGVLSEDWSALNYVNNWSVSNDLVGSWIGDETLAHTFANISTFFSAAFVNKSQYNRSQSLIWTKVTNVSANSDYVFSGVVYAYYNYTNFSMVLFGDDEVFLFDYVDDGKSPYLRNTLYHEYDPSGHGGAVLIYDDAINYWSDSGVSLTDPDGAWIKTIYNTYCGSLKSKYWDGSPTLMAEPRGWHIEEQSTNMSTDDAVCFGVAFWNPADYGCSNYSVHYDYINNWRLNYTLNSSATITIDGVDHPRPHMNFPIIDMNNQGDDWWSLIMPSDFGGTSANITDPIVSSSIRNITNNLSMESRPFSTPVGRGPVNNDTIYYYTATLTNFTDWYIAYLEANPGILAMDPEYFSNNYLMLYVQNCEDEYAGSDSITIGIDVDNNGQWDDNDRLILNDASWWGWGGYTWTGNYLDGMDTFYSNVFMYTWTTDSDAPHNIHRYGNHVYYLTLIPLWSLVKSDGEYLNNSDVFGLHISTYSSEHYGWGMCIWENWNETGCSTFFSEVGTASDNANRYYNTTTGLTQECWNAIYDCWDSCAAVCTELCCTACEPNCWEDCMDDLMGSCLSCEECMIDIPDSNMSLWGEGEIPGSPPVNSSSGNFDLDIDVDSNVSYIPNEDMNDVIRINLSSDITNDGDETIDNILINVTWNNCTCSYWVFSLVNTNINLSNVSWYNSSCYMTFNVSQLLSGATYSFWIIIDIEQCEYRYDTMPLCVNASSSDGVGVWDVECTDIVWGDDPADDIPTDTEGGGGGILGGDNDVSVDVYDDTGTRPIEGAYVEIYDEDGGLVDWGYTDEDGRFTTSLDPGVYTVVVLIDGYIEQSQIWIVTQDGDVIMFLMETCLCPPIFHGPYFNLSILGWIVTFLLILVGFYISHRIRYKKLDQDYLITICIPNIILIILGLLCQPILILIGAVCLFLQFYYHKKN